MKKRSIAIGDAVALLSGERGEIILVSRSGKLLLIRLKPLSTAAAGEPAYLLCRAGEARRINAWWNDPARRETGKRSGLRPSGRRIPRRRVA